jgi:Na+/melibiose symporter-like transporter
MTLNQSFQTLIFFLFYFSVDLFRIPAAHLATIFLINRILDKKNDLMSGATTDSTKAHLIQFRAYYPYAVLPFGILGLNMSIVPKWNTQGKDNYAVIIYNCMMICTAAFFRLLFTVIKGGSIRNYFKHVFKSKYY